MGSSARGKRHFFRHREAGGPKGDSRTASKFIDCGLFELGCILIGRGHSDPFDYGYSYFIRAVNRAMIAEYEETKQMAVAMRTARFTKKDEWNRYMREKPPRGIL